MKMQSGQPRQSPASARLRMRLSPAGERALRAGHPWVFASSVRDQNRPGKAGELAVIYDRQDRFLAIGLHDPESPLRVRVLHAGKPLTIDHAWWSARLAQAVERRRQVGLGNGGTAGSGGGGVDVADRPTTGYRLINGESDGWPGLVLDRYDGTLVIKIYTAAWLPRLSEVLKLIHEQVSCERIILRWSRNIAEDVRGFKLPPIGAGQKTESAVVLSGNSPSRAIVFQETGIRFEADVLRGQKTGFFLDQRENRRMVESLARGRAVLNAFSFTGGFSLYAARGRAESVTDLDISTHALECAQRNFTLNASVPEIARCRQERVQADALDWLAQSGRRKFGLIVLDPPSFAKREAERANAIRTYGRMASLAVERLGSGGILVACSCSAHVSASEFFQAVRSSVSAVQGRFEELRTTGHAPDHPATFNEAEYLKAIYLRLRTGC